MTMSDPRQVDERFYRLLEEIQAVDFVLVELNLYLDTHRNDMNALNQYNQYTEQRWRLSHEFEDLYGPLMHFGHSYSCYPWQWTETPWPWQV